MPLGLYVKDPDEVVDYQIDWSTRMHPGDSIASVAVNVETGLVLDATSTVDTTSTVRLSGGTLGERYRVEFRATTTDGEKLEESIYIAIREA